MLVLGGSISQEGDKVEFICSKRGTKIKTKEMDLRTLDKTFIFI